MYGAFKYQGQVVQFQPDSNLRDNEDVPLTAETARGANVNAVNETYFNKEVAPHVEDAWIDAGKCDGRDEQIGVVGYEIPFNRHFYQYEPPRDLAEIDADLDVFGLHRHCSTERRRARRRVVLLHYLIARLWFPSWFLSLVNRSLLSLCRRQE